MPWTKDNLPPSVKNKNWSDHQKEVFCKTANAMLDKGTDEGECIATGIKQAESEHRNANQFPKAFYCRHMQPGLCGYGTEKVLVDVEAMKRMIGADAVGKPIYILHNEAPNEERLKKLQEEAAGYITDSFYNELDGWAWFEFLAISDSAHQAIAQGWAVSNAYIPTEWGPAGTKNNVPYDREIVSGVFTHLAIVPDPRYEDAVIMTPEKFKAYQESKRRQLEELQNSSDQPKGKPMFKFFKNERKEVSAAAVDAETLVELEDGKTVTVAEMMNAMKKNNEESVDDETLDDEKQNFKEEKAQELENAMVDCDGEKMPLKELINRYTAMKKNEKEAEEKKNAEDKAAKEKADKEEAEEKERQNSRFKELQNANQGKGDIAPTVLETSVDKIKRGMERY